MIKKPKLFSFSFPVQLTVAWGPLLTKVCRHRWQLRLLDAGLGVGLNIEHAHTIQDS